jgi:hypothetical protein
MGGTMLSALGIIALMMWPVLILPYVVRLLRASLDHRFRVASETKRNKAVIFS